MTDDSYRDECRNIQLKVEILRFKMVEKLEKLYPIQCDSANAKISIRGVSLKNGMVNSEKVNIF
jgi:hypothetical protein